MKHTIIGLILLIGSTNLSAQVASLRESLRPQLERYFTSYRQQGQTIRSTFHLDALGINDSTRVINVVADTHFSEQLFTPETVEKIYADIDRLIPQSHKNYKLTVWTNCWPIEWLVPSRLKDNNQSRQRDWAAAEHDGRPWVENISRPLHITKGLQGRHLSLWASHGRYYDIGEGRWKWQRPALFSTREDLFTQTIVVPYLIPMLEKAGAVVFTPRERDWQRHEVIVDNDRPDTLGTYIEESRQQPWHTFAAPGFALHQGPYQDGENPFEAGTARMATTVSGNHNVSTVSYQPQIPQEGRYAVYVSYQTTDNSIDDAHYTVWHKGVKTEFSVNQQMGGGTWVYLGTFLFDKGCNEYNRVTLNNKSRHHGVVTTDAIRFGGGMGNIARGDTLSGMPRCLEGARYYAQWAGMPYYVYSTKNGQDDYGDDINARSCMTNLLAGGSCYMPDTVGRGVPIELSLAIHSDAGYTRDGKTMTGPLSICTTNHNDQKLNSGLSRLSSRDLADDLLSAVSADMKALYGQWPTRELYDRNYSETRLPEVPSAILETLSHQNFADMRYAQDPNFRFQMARSIYKALLRYIARMHNTECVTTPLSPASLQAELTAPNEARISWAAVDDPLDDNAHPTAYILYTAIGNADYDNGQLLKSAATSCTVKIEPGRLYTFRVAAVNAGGESFPSEAVSVMSQPKARRTVVVVNGFHRLSSPAVRDNSDDQGFDIMADPGITYGSTAGWLGQQTVFDKSRMGVTDDTGLGFSTEELAGTIIAGNDMDYIRTHAQAIAACGNYNIASCSAEAVECGDIQLDSYNIADIILGLEKDDGHSLVSYKALPQTLQDKMAHFTARGGALLVSGSYVGSDMTTIGERLFLTDILKCRHAGTYTAKNDIVNGLGTKFAFHRQLNEKHYAATHPDIVQAVEPAYPAMAYADGTAAAVAYDGSDYKSFVMGFPLECIKDAEKRTAIMRGILQFLSK